MTAISVKSDTKDRWDELKPEDMTHNEFAQAVLDAYQKDTDGVVVDPDEIATEITERLEKKTALAIHKAAYNGVREGLDA